MTALPDPAWLHALQAGDKVVVVNARQRKTVATVHHITRTQIVVQCGSVQQRFSRTKGWVLGCEGEIQPYTPEQAAAIRLATAQQRLDSLLRHLPRPAIAQLTLAQCAAVEAVLRQVGLVDDKETTP